MVRVGLQIRFEVMNVINKNPLKSVKLPSAQELADPVDIQAQPGIMLPPGIFVVDVGGGIKGLPKLAAVPGAVGIAMVDDLVHTV